MNQPHDDIWDVILPGKDLQKVVERVWVNSSWVGAVMQYTPKLNGGPA
jgi:hypothetical protein